ncbi:GNAT family N-acetyltransferase [Microterricola viridarii]|uniref:GNAT family N-acetyltransferase n=1 Tax=Microterricola viridarii TaxID=412690 RepID=UPI001E58A1D8|nr:GNAT family protein [Microterricola viridarii]
MSRPDQPDVPLILPRLEGPALSMRAFRGDDVDAIREAGRDRLVPLITTVPEDADQEQALAFIRRQHDRLRRRAGYSFAIADADDVAIGQIGLWLRDERHGRASIGYWLRPSARGRGLAAAALAVLCDWACTLPQLNRLELYVEPWNEASWRTAERAGFVREGLMRSWQIVDGTPRDMYMYSLLTATQR